MARRQRLGSIGQVLAGSEDEHHMALMAWARLNPILVTYLYHIPNEGKRSPQEGARLKAKGLKPGASDLFLSYPCRGYHGFYIELKAPKKKPTVAQLQFLADMREVGYKAEWYDNWEQAAYEIKFYLEG